MPKVRLIPYQNANFWQKMAIFEKCFFKKKVSKRLKIKGNSLKCHFFLIYGFLEHFFVIKLNVKIGQR